MPFDGSDYTKRQDELRQTLILLVLARTHLEMPGVWIQGCQERRHRGYGLHGRQHCAYGALNFFHKRRDLPIERAVVALAHETRWPALSRSMDDLIAYIVAHNDKISTTLPSLLEWFDRAIARVRAELVS